MKLGTFIGQGTLSLEENEMNNVIVEVSKIINKKFDGIDYTFEACTPNSYDNEKTLLFVLNFKDSKTRKDIHNNTYLPKYMKITLYKQKGYDEAEVGKFYEWEDGFEPKLDKVSYSSSVDLIGLYRRYRGKNVESYVGITPTTYQYGTELDDIDFEMAIDKISRYIKSSSISKVELEEYQPYCLRCCG